MVGRDTVGMVIVDITVACVKTVVVVAVDTEDMPQCGLDGVVGMGDRQETLVRFGLDAMLVQQWLGAENLSFPWPL